MDTQTITSLPQVRQVVAPSPSRCEAGERLNAAAAKAFNPPDGGLEERAWEAHKMGCHQCLGHYLAMIYRMRAEHGFDQLPRIWQRKGFIEGIEDRLRELETA